MKLRICAISAIISVIFAGCSANSKIADESELNPDIRNDIKQCCMEFKTQNWYGRIDETFNKPAEAMQNWRLTLWKKGRSIGDKPDINLYGANCHEGTCGAGYYLFPDSGCSIRSTKIDAYLLSYSCSSDERMELVFDTDLPIKQISDSLYVIDDFAIEDDENFPWKEIWRETVEKRHVLLEW